MSRDKGAKWEREIASHMAAHGWPNAKRRGIGFEDHDLIGTHPYSVECKNQARWSVPAWWRQTEEQAEATGATPLLVMKRPGFSDPGQGLAVIKFSHFCELAGTCAPQSP